MDSTHILNNEIEEQIPVNEPARQEYFMDKCHEIVEEIIIKNGKAPTFHVSTFGCQMNAHDSEKLSGILEKIGYAETEEDRDDRKNIKE